MKTVTMQDGRQVPSDAPEWQLETLAKWVMAMPLHKRQAWLAEVPAPMKETICSEMTRLRSIPLNA